MSNFLKEFKSFALKGNVVDMAVGIVIGTAFSKIVSSVVGDLLMPILSVFLDTTGDFTSLKLILRQAVINPDNGEIVKPALTLAYGNFIQVVVDFLIIAVSVFILVKAINKAKELTKKEEAKVAPSKPADVAVLEEIRDILLKK